MITLPNINQHPTPKGIHVTLAPKESPLAIAAKKRDWDEVLRLLDEMADVPWQLKSRMREAARMDRHERFSSIYAAAFREATAEILEWEETRI